MDSRSSIQNDFFFGEKTEKAMSLDFENVLPPSILTDGNVVYERSENDRTNKVHINAPSKCISSFRMRA